MFWPWSGLLSAFAGIPGPLERTHNGFVFERYSYRSRCLIFMARWSAQRRGGVYIEPEDLLHALIRDDRKELSVIFGAVFPGAEASGDFYSEDHKPFFSESAARTLLRELREQPDLLVIETAEEKREPAPHVDMPVSRSLKQILALVAEAHQNDKKIIEPL